uniref:Ovule protein n=1 Tax=Mesocestoides corti TaxID=53468 RepID=A0A5K3ENG7_MESCO
MSGEASVADSDGRGLTCGCGLCLVNKACSVVPVIFILELRYSTCVKLQLTTNFNTPILSNICKELLPHLDFIPPNKFISLCRI